MSLDNPACDREPRPIPVCDPSSGSRGEWFEDVVALVAGAQAVISHGDDGFASESSR